MRNDYVKGGSDPNANTYGYGYGYGYGDQYGYGGTIDGGGGPSRNLRDYMLIVRERIWYLIIAFFIIFSGSIIYTFNKTKLYTSAAQLQILRDDPSVLGQGGLDTNQIRGAEDLNTQINLMESGVIISRVAARLTPDDRDEFLAPYIGGTFLTAMLSPEEILARNRRIQPRRMSLMIQIAYTHPVAEVAAKIANLFAEEFIEYNSSRTVDTSMRAVEELRIRADQQRQRVEEIEMQLANYRERHKAVSIDSQENVAREELSALNNLRIAAKNQEDFYETQWEMLQQYRQEERPLSQLEFVAQHNRVNPLLSKISGLRIELATVGQRYRERHPVMIQMREALTEAESELRKEIDNAIDELSGRLSQARTNSRLTQQRLSEKERELINLSKLRVEFNSLQRDLAVQEGFHQALVGQMTREQAQIQLRNANARIIDRAGIPLRPSSPNVLMNLLAGAFGGLAVGAGLIFIVAFLDDRVKSAFDIEGAVGLPLLGVIARIKRLDSNAKAQAVASNADRHVTEAFRSIYSSLKLGEDSRNAKILLTTSTIPGEGKSFVSTNICLTFASHGERVLLIDGDLRLPNVAKSLQIDNSVGLIQYLEKGLPIEDCIQSEVYPNLDVLPAGGTSKNPLSLLNKPAFEELLMQFRGQYDRIVIDSPPLAAVSDALNVLPLADGLIYVIRFNMVKRRTAQFSVRKLREANAPILGAVLNNIKSNLSSYYYSHYYSSDYKDYYALVDESEQLLERNPRPEDGPEATAEVVR
jgi:succinoglycan biosynthesis transport protein ExoP